MQIKCTAAAKILLHKSSKLESKLKFSSWGKRNKKVTHQKCCACTFGKNANQPVTGCWKPEDGWGNFFIEEQNGNLYPSSREDGFLFKFKWLPSNSVCEASWTVPDHEGCAAIVWIMFHFDHDVLALLGTCHECNFDVSLCEGKAAFFRQRNVQRGTSLFIEMPLFLIGNCRNATIP